MKSFQDQPALVLALLEVKKGNVKNYSFGFDWLLARKFRSSLKWSYLVHHSSLLNVVPLEGEKIGRAHV